jgi:hypothetical protein
MTRGWPILRFARTLFVVLAVVVLLGGLLELFLFPTEVGSTQTLSDKLEVFGIVAHVVGTVAEAFALIVSAELIGLWLAVHDNVSTLLSRVSEERHSPSR